MQAARWQLSTSQINEFIECGFLKIEDAFDRKLASEAREILWQELGLSKNQPDTWDRPVIRLGMHSERPFIEAANSERLVSAYDALTGKNCWAAPQAVGTFPIRFPSSDDPGDTGWHVDMSLDYEKSDFMEWRINSRSEGRLLLMLFLFSDVGEKDAPTKIRVGSHLQIARQLSNYGDGGLTLRELSRNGFAESENCTVAYATGPAGTVYLCHPFIVHSAQPHRGTQPKFMAQPPLLPKRDLVSSLILSPVQEAIRRASAR